MVTLPVFQVVVEENVILYVKPVVLKGTSRLRKFSLKRTKIHFKYKTTFLLDFELDPPSFPEKT